MRAVTIDPFNRSVMETDVDGSVESIRAALECSMFQIAHVFETGDTLYVDEDGIARAQDALAGKDEGARAFAFDVGAHQPFYGRGIILGPEDSSGRHTDAVLSLARLSGIVFLVPKVMQAGGPAPN